MARIGYHMTETNCRNHGGDLVGFSSKINKYTKEAKKISTSIFGFIIMNQT